MLQRKLFSDENAISSFSLMAIILLLFASFSVSYLSYVTHIDSNYRLRMEDITKMELKSLEIIRDLEYHAVFLAREKIQEGNENDFEDDYYDYIEEMAEEGFDIWLGGDVRATVNGVYAVIGGTVRENYTVSLTPLDNGTYLVSGSFNVTISNLRTDLVLKKVVNFERQISTADLTYAGGLILP